jgi:hypothetical protein
MVEPVVFLHLLDDFSARANHGTDELLGNLDGHDARYLWLHLGTRLRHGLHHLAHDMLATGLGCMRACSRISNDRPSHLISIWVAVSRPWYRWS